MTNKHSVQAIKSKYREVWKYAHTLEDLQSIAHRQGIVSMYHGCPLPYAESLMITGPRQYTVYALARRVAVIYDLNWSQFQEFAYRKHEVITKMSTAPAPIAVRWAWHFPLGEVLTDLNSHARMVAAANKKARRERMRFYDAYEELYNEALRAARLKDIQYTIESAPDILGIEDRLALSTREGAIIQVRLDSSHLPDHIVYDAEMYLKYIPERGILDSLLDWNVTYIDVKVPKEYVISMKIVVKGLFKYQSDEIDRMISEGELVSNEVKTWIA